MSPKTVTIYEAYYFLQQSVGILLEGRYLEPILFELDEDPAKEWLHLQWDDMHEDEMLVVHVAFNEGDNQWVTLKGSNLVLINTDGEEEEITLLQEWHPLVK